MDVLGIPCTWLVGHVVVGLGVGGTAGAAQVARMPGYQRMQHEMNMQPMLAHIHPTFYKLKQTFTLMMQLVIYLKGTVQLKLHLFFHHLLSSSKTFIVLSFMKQKGDVKQKTDGDLYCQGLKAP